MSAQHERLHVNDAVRAARLAENLKSQTTLGLADGGDPAFGVGWFDAADLATGVPHAASTDVETRLLERLQLPDGRWRHGPPRVPIESSAFAATADAARVLKAQKSTDGRAAFATSVTKARIWLLQHERLSAWEVPIHLVCRDVLGHHGVDLRGRRAVTVCQQDRRVRVWGLVMVFVVESRGSVTAVQRSGTRGRLDLGDLLLRDERPRFLLHDQLPGDQRERRGLPGVRGRRSDFDLVLAHIGDPRGECRVERGDDCRPSRTNSTV